MKHLAIIPARSGSRRLADKNIKDFHGSPLMAHTIEAANRSNIFEEVMVSTDSERYGEIARQYGAQVPFLRSRETASDQATSWDMVREVMERYLEQGRRFDTFALLQPTSPLRTEADIVDAYQILRQKNAEGVVSVCEADHPPFWYGTLPADHSVKQFLGDKGKPGQGAETYYRLNGAIYIMKTDYFLKGGTIFGTRCYAHIMERKHSIDIDTEFDFHLALKMWELK